MLKDPSKYQVVIPKLEHNQLFEQPIWIHSFDVFSEKKSKEQAELDKVTELEKFESALIFLLKHSKTETDKAAITILLTTWLARHNYMLFTNDMAESEKKAVELSEIWFNGISESEKKDLGLTEKQLEEHQAETRSKKVKELKEIEDSKGHNKRLRNVGYASENVKEWKKEIHEKYPFEFEVLSRITNLLIQKNGFQESVNSIALKKATHINDSKELLVHRLHPNFDEKDVDMANTISGLKKFISEELVAVLLLRWEQHYKELIYSKKIGPACLKAATDKEIKLSPELKELVMKDAELEKICRNHQKTQSNLEIAEEMLKRINAHPLKVYDDFSFNLKSKSQHHKEITLKNQNSKDVPTNDQKNRFKSIPSKPVIDTIDKEKFQVMSDSFFRHLSDEKKFEFMFELARRSPPSNQEPDIIEPSTQPQQNNRL